MNDNRWQRMEEIFHRAVELAPEARSAFLDQSCGGDSPLRQEVESLLAHESEEGSTFAGPGEAPRSIGHYRIVGKLGEGGMGAVYRGTDTKLDRDVAIKVLPAAFANDPDRMARFQREAKVLASLNHPNIAAIYGVEERALIMELVPGEDLRGPLPVATALQYAEQIAAALDAAHERGIVHRDLKPGNIRITPDGVVKVLDFGLATAAQLRTDSGESPTITATGAGVIMGTPAYMAPEQARGQAVDKRADIWAFGVVLFEMLAGKRIFGGESISDSLAAVLTREPDFTLLPKDTPPRVRQLLERCLRKDRKQRLRDVGDAHIALQEPETGISGSPAGSRAWIPWSVAGVLGLALLLAGGAWLRPKSAAPDTAVARFLIPLPSGTGLPTSAFYSTQWVPSPDGRNLAMIAEDFSTGKTALWVRPLGATSPYRLDRTEGAMFPFWSPDGQKIGFFVENTLKRVAISGGNVQIVCQLAVWPTGGAWGQDGVILYGSNAGPLMRVDAMGGVPQPVTALAQDEIGHASPQILADGRHILYSAQNKEPANSAIYVQEPGSAKRVLVVKSRRAIWSRPGYLLFVRERSLFAQRMDPKTFQVEGEARAVAQNVAADDEGQGSFAVSETGVLAYRNGAPVETRQLTWRDRDGKVLGAVGPPGKILSPSLSPDGKSVAMTMGDVDLNTWVMDLATGVPARMTQGKEAPVFYAPVLWSPDSQRLAVTQAQRGVEVITLASGEILPIGKERHTADDWTADGRAILCRGPGGPSLLTVADGRRDPATTKGRGGGMWSRFSPDGRYVVYMSIRPGSSEIYAASFPSFAIKRKVSSVDGYFPVWAKGGKEIFYRSNEGWMMSVAIRAGAGIEAGVPKPLFKFGSGSMLVNRFAVNADGTRFLVAEPMRDGEADKPAVTLVLNWASEMKLP
jgi:eukaryotic-like serine/threonine-protein kinase